VDENNLEYTFLLKYHSTLKKRKNYEKLKTCTIFYSGIHTNN